LPRFVVTKSPSLARPRVTVIMQPWLQIAIRFDA
jgi:hypothetical protein